LAPSVKRDKKEERRELIMALCPFSWIEVTKRAGCLASLFGGKDKLIWEAQQCMTTQCQLWDSAAGNCSLAAKKTGAGIKNV
jgi:hypothetical protein